MEIIKRTQKEIIDIYHENKEVMSANLTQLKEEGWSDNTRLNMAGEALWTEPIFQTKLFTTAYPDIQLYEYQPGDVLRYENATHYVYLTVHERQVSL